MTEETKDPAKEEMLAICTQKYEMAFAEKNNIAYAVLQALNFVVQQSNETTIQAMYQKLQVCSDHVLQTIRNSPALGDRTLLSVQCLIKIYFRMA